MKDGKIVVGIMGLQFGLRHMDGAIENGYEIGAICDNLPGRLEDYGTEYKIPRDRWYTDYKDCLNIGLDVVVLAVPDQMHRQMSEDFLAAGVNVLCEKPLALNREDLCAIIKAEKASTARFMVGQVCRFTSNFILAKQMIDEGCLRNPDVRSVIGLHVESTVPTGAVLFTPGPMNAASCEFYVTVEGKSCHGAHPDLGVDAIVIAANIITALQTIISRNLDPAEALVITIGKIQGGTKENVVAGQVHMSGTLRSLNYENRDFAKKRMKALASSVAEAYGGSCDITFDDGYPPLINDTAVTDALVSAASEAYGADSVIFRENASLGADDFAFFCQAVPSSYFNIGASDFHKGTPAPAHSEGFNPEEECMKYAMVMEIAGALKLMEE